ncbi:hypothetical protein [Microbulbifer epialgicus]|uniref:Uncharacterized protein n=1 Tax=Microbulbifer epialgicus TaxID=393907 RepID=A0ABV4NWZ9_9GAMM
MCRDNGGGIIYEVGKVSEKDFPSSRLRSNGSVKIPFKKYAGKDDLFYLDAIYSELKSGNPSVAQYTVKIIRAADNKVMGEFISFSRVGQTFPVPFPVPSTSCEGDFESADKFVKKIINVKE